MNFTEMQEKAYKAYGTNYLISAGAGSGKTQVLSERVRFLVQEKGFKINEFLILTFTNLAAQEMKERIRKKLLEINSPEAEKVDNASICTFDSYALLLVKKYHYLLNLDKNISLIDENIIKIFIKEKIDEILLSLYQKQDVNLLNFIKKFCFKDDKLLKELIYDVYQKSKDHFDSEDYLSSLVEKGSIKNAIIFLNNYSYKVDQLFDDLCLASENCPNEKFKNEFRIIRDNYLASDSLDSKINYIKQVKFPIARGMEEEDKKLYDQYKDNFKDIIKYFTSSEDFYADNKISLEFTPWLVSIVKQLLELDYQFKFEHQSFVFSDIARFAIKILKENKSIAEEIKNSLKTIMIDEYQDTSPIQESLISLISNNNVYMVGDIKQSIYRFRNATPELFIEKFANYKEHKGGELISLYDNFRSRKEVLDDINKIFSDIMTLDLGGAEYKKDHIIQNGNKIFASLGDTGHSNNIDFLCYDEDKDTEPYFIVYDIINKINSGYLVYNDDMKNPALRKIKLSDFCILLDRGSSFYKYQKVFKEFGIPLLVENNVNIATHDIVLCISSLLHLVNCINQKDFSSSEFRHAFVSFSRSFIINYSDNEIFLSLQNSLENHPLIIELKEFINDNKYLTPDELIFKLIHHFKFYQHLALIGDIRINEKYLDSFLSTIKSLSSILLTFDEYVSYFESLQKLNLKLEIPSVSSDFDAVRIMNIFKSKGLEFPVIYCAGLSSNFNTQDLKKEIIISEKYGIIYPTSKLDRSILYYQNKEEESLTDISEKIRLLYVALTRAKEKIICVMPKVDKVKPLEKTTCLGDLFSSVINKFNIINCNVGDPLNTHGESISTRVLIRDIECEEKNIIPIKANQVTHASKNLSLNANYDFIKLGEHLHLLLECTDFMNPDINNLSNEFDRRIINNFLQSTIIKSLKNPIFYKEYEFISDTNQKGIIDLLIIDDNQAIIVDYKLKNISDEKYIDQLKVYYSFVTEHFKLKTTCFLYSILQSEIKEVKF